METKDFRDSLSMIDSRGHRLSIIPAEVTGFFKRRKTILHSFLLLIFLALPWIKLGGHQSIHLDVVHREFHFLGLHLQAHDAPLIFFVLLTITMALALVTALWGRVWCGWACPQTVFIESVFRRIEIWVEGNYIQRRKMEQDSLSTKDLLRKLIKWILFFCLSFLLSHSFLAYWVGGDELWAMVGSSPRQNSFYFTLVMSMTALVLFNFGWFREQFCLIVCPYGRVQSLLHDNQTKTIMYDEKRGEPRKGSAVLQEQTSGTLSNSSDPSSKKGDCVSCRRCVQVCPTGIDIRNGLQMECIGCTACLDACDEIMSKIQKPQGLIRYKSMTDTPISWFRTRVLIYSGILLFSVSSLGFLLSHHSQIRVELLRPKDIPFVVRESNGQKYVHNHFKLRLENDHEQSAQVEVKVETKDIRLIIPENPIVLPARTKRDIPLFIETSLRDFRSSDHRVEVLIKTLDTSEVSVRKTVHLLGPMN